MVNLPTNGIHLLTCLERWYLVLVTTALEFLKLNIAKDLAKASAQKFNKFEV